MEKAASGTATLDGPRGLQVHGQDIPWLLRHWAGARPDHPALVWEPADGEGRAWTYAELLRDTDRLAAGLTGRGVALGDKVLIHAENCPEMLLAWLACASIGAVAVTTNTRAAPAEIAWFVGRTGATAAVTQPRFAEHVAAASGLRWVAVIGADAAAAAPADAADADAAAAAAPAAAPDAAPDSLAFDSLYGDDDAWAGRPIDPMLPFGIMFTSGTTSKPKAVVHTHANAVWASRSGPRTIDLGPDDRYLICLPLFHVNAQSWSFFSVLGVGATAVLMPKWSTSRFWDVVARNGITHISLMPFCMGALASPDRPETPLRVGVFGFVSKALEAMLHVKVYAAFGMTETVTHAVSGKPAEGLPDRSMGRPTPGYQFAVVNKDTGEVCAPGETGELWLRGERGVQLFLEYHGDPEATNKAFHGGWFKTGDMVVLEPGGNIFYRERDKDLLKVGGENVSAREVEELIATVPGVGQVAVVGKHHDFLDEVVVAFVITTPDAPDEATLEKNVIEACRGRLADYKVPRAVYRVEEFPLGTLDKLLKNKLRDMADERPPV